MARGLGAPMSICRRRRPRLIIAHRAPLGRERTASTAPCTACATCWPRSPNANPNASAKGSARPTGRRSTRPSTSATEGNGSWPWSASSIGPATAPRRDVRRRRRRARRPPALPDPPPPAMAQHEPPRAIARRGQTPHQVHRPLPPAKPAASPSSGPSSASTSPTPPTASIHPARAPAPQARGIRGPRRHHSRGSHRRLDSPLPGTWAAAKLQQLRDATDLATLRFIEEKANVLLIGRPGVGKTMVATGHGRRAGRAAFPAPSRAPVPRRETSARHRCREEPGSYARKTRRAVASVAETRLS